MARDVPSLQSLRRVCIVHLSGIGDVVHGLPIARELKAAKPDLEITWVAEPAPAEVLRHHPSVDRIVVFHKAQGLRGLLRLRRELQTQPVDLVVNMQRYIKSVFPSLFCGAPVRLGLPASMTRDGVSWFHTHSLPEQPWKHSQDLVLEFRGPLGLSPDTPVEWGITFSDTERQSSDEFFRDLGPGLRVGLVLGSANAKKDWPAERYVPLIESLHGRGWRTLLLGGPGRAERAAAQWISEHTSCPVVDALDDSVRAMMWKVGGMDLLVSPDTGPLHIAHALNVPVIGLFGHTNPWRTGPWKRYHDLIVDRYTEPGSDPNPADYDSKDGRMDLITVADVLEKVETFRTTYLPV